MEHRTTLRLGAAGLSLGAAVVYALRISPMYDAGSAYGIAFILAGLLQTSAALLLLTQPWRYDPAGNAAAEEDIAERRWYRWVVLLNSALIVLVVLGSAPGVAGVLPGDGGALPNPVTWLAAALEAGVVACLVVLLRRAPARSTLPRPT